MGTGKHRKKIQKTSPIVLAIQDCEQNTTGKIRVHLSQRWFEKDPYPKAQALFESFQLSQNPDRNAVFIYLNLRTRKFVIIADIGFQAVIDPHFWMRFSQQLRDNLLSTQSERAIALSLALLKTPFQKHFPIESLPPKSD